MAVGVSAAVTLKPLHGLFSDANLHHFKHAAFFHPLPRLHQGGRQKASFVVCFVVEEQKQSTQIENGAEEDRSESTSRADATINAEIFAAARVAEQLARKKSERLAYLVAAVMSSFGITSMVVMAVYYRFSWQMEGAEVPLSEMFGKFSLSVGAAEASIIIYAKRAGRITLSYSLLGVLAMAFVRLSNSVIWH